MLASSRKPCGGANPRGRIWNPPLRPTANVEANRETTNPAIPQTNVGDDACIVPETPRRRKVPREGHGPPLQTMENAAANRCGLDHPGDRRAGCPHPAGPCGGGNVRGRIWNPPLRPTAKCCGQPGNRNLQVIINLCRGRCLHRPANPAAAETPAGGYGIRPYGQRQMLRPTGKQQTLRYHKPM